jgi:sarcosine oxidase subunit gamma
MVNLEVAKSPLSGAKVGGLDKAVLIQEVPFTPGFDLRVAPGTPAFNAVNAALGLTLSETVGKVVRNNAACIVDGSAPAPGGISALALGPDWWYLTGTADIQSILAEVPQTHHVSLVDVSSQRTKIELYGPSAKATLSHYWEQDLRDSKFPIDSCSQGLLAKAPVILWHCCENCYLIFPRASFSQHLWTALSDAAIEYL